MDLKISCPWLLFFPSFSWISSRFVCLEINDMNVSYAGIRRISHYCFTNLLQLDIITSSLTEYVEV